MSIVININSGGEEREPVSEGVHQAVLADVADLGVVPTNFGDKHKVQFVYITDEADSGGRTKYVFERFTASLHEKASLRKRVKQLVGADISGESFDIESLIGRQVQLVIQHNEAQDGSGKIYANVVSAMKPVPKQRIEIPGDFVRKKDRPAKEGIGQAKQQRPTNGRAVAAAVYAPPAPTSAQISDDDIPF